MRFKKVPLLWIVMDLLQSLEDDYNKAKKEKDELEN